jgi:hypothetical protein
LLDFGKIKSNGLYVVPGLRDPAVDFDIAVANDILKSRQIICGQEVHVARAVTHHGCK